MMPHRQRPQLCLFSPAKLNLFLHIVRQRADGYHQIQSLFQLLDFGDSLSFRLRNDHKITLSGQSIAIEDNLIYQAACLLRCHITQNRQPSQTGYGVDISIDKRIPSGAGAGGGSSNAASTLIGLNCLWGAHLDNSQLCQLGLRLGADVPFFIQGRSAFVGGIGENIRPVQLADSWYVLIKPPHSVSTASVFQAVDLPRNTPEQPLHTLLDNQTAILNWQQTHNDCEKLVCRRIPLVAAIIDWLQTYGPARMTGTGSLCFLPCKSALEAHKIEQRFIESFAEAKHCFTTISRGIAYTP